MEIIQFRARKGIFEVNERAVPGVTGKTVFYVGDFLLEGVEEKVLALNYTFQRQGLREKSSVWSEIENDLISLDVCEKLLTIILCLSKQALIRYSSSELLLRWNTLLDWMKKAPSLILIDEECLQQAPLSSELDEILQECSVYLQEYINFNKQLLNSSIPSNLQKVVDFRNMNSYHIKLERTGSITYSYKKSSKSNGFTIGAHHYKYRPSYKGVLRIIQTIFDEMQNVRKWEIRRFLPKEADNSDVVNYDLGLVDYDKELRTLLQRHLDYIEPLFEQFQRDFEDKRTEQSLQVKRLLEILQDSGVEIIPCKTRKAMSICVHHYLDEIDKGVFLHLYVPNGRYQEDQLASFLRLFESYLQRVENLQFFIEIRKTLHGQIYEFKSRNVAMNLTDVQVALSRFDQFMGLCQNDQKKAEDILLRAGVNPPEANRLLTKYMKEYQRFLLDIEHERERKLLDLRQRLESEALDLTSGTSLSITQSAQPSTLLSLPHNVDPLITISNSSVIINPGLQSYVEQAIYGDIHYTAEDRKLLELFEKYTERLETVLLRSELEQLKDTSSPTVERETAKQKIVGFLSKVAPAIGQSALTILTAYLEKLLIGS